VRRYILALIFLAPFETEGEQCRLRLIVIIVIIRCIINAAAAELPSLRSRTKSLSMVPGGHLHN